MPQLVKKRRSGWAVLAAGAMVASILAAGASPAAAQTADMPDHRPDVTPYWSACVGAAGSHDAMFPDVNADSVHAGDINCIAYYGITLGKNDGSYGPSEHVTAFQMRLFVQRAADLMGADGEAVLGGVMLSDTVTRLEMAQLMFGLLDDMLDWVRINSDGDIEFDRDGNNVWQKGTDFFADAKAQVPIAESELIGATYELGVVRGRSANVSTDDSVFAPSDPVTRAEMASFITRTLDHSNLRPEGLAAQRNKGVEGDDPETQVSLRDADFQPIEDAYIDAFSSIYPDDAFDDDGECVGRFIRDEGGESDDACEISRLDEITDDDGNATFTLTSDVAPIALMCTTAADSTDVSYNFKSTGDPTSRTNWAWSGDLGDEVDEDTDLVEVEDVNRPIAGDPPNHAHITGGLPTGNELAKMGETVTFTVQIRTGGKDPQPTGPDRSGNPYHLRITKHYVGADADSGDDNGSADTAADGNLLEVPGDWDYLSATDRTRPAVTTAAEAQFQTPFDSLVRPNGDGEFSITLTNMDLDAATDDTDVAVRFALTPFVQGNDLIDGNLLSSISANANYAGGNDPAAAATNPAALTALGYVVFSDNPSRLTSVSGSSASSYRIIDSGGTGNSVTVSVTDQYGDPMRNVGINVESSLDGSVGGPSETPAAPANDDDEARYPEAVDDTVEDDEAADDASPKQAEDVSSRLDTRRNGTYRIGYSYTGSDPKTETITPDGEIPAVVDNPDTTEDETAAAEVVPGDAVTVYFAKVGNSSSSHTTPGGDAESVEILVPDTDSRAIVVNEGADTGDNPQVYYYDEEDNFTVDGIPATLEMFEEALGLTLKDDKFRPDRVLWESYDFHRPGDRAIFELTMSCDPRT